MSIRNRLLTMAAVSALTAATAVPAMALENEFHGMTAIRAFNSNYLAGTAGKLNIDADTAKTRNWIEQRTRLFYSAKANDDLKLVTGFEADSNWGGSSYTTNRQTGGALGSDSTNLETKWAYLDFNDPWAKANFKVGIQGLNDGYKGLVVGVGADAAGIQVSKAVGPVSGTLGWFRLDDRNTATADAGKNTRDILMLSGNVALSKAAKVGASYYFLNDDKAAKQAAQTANVPTDPANDYNVHILGASAAATFGPAAVDAFGIYEFGTVGTTHVNAFAGNVAAKVQAGPAAVKVAGLYVSGNSSTTFGGNSFVSVNNTGSNAFAENGVGAIGNLWLLVRNPKESTNEQAIIAESSNSNQGIIGGSIGADFALGKTFANVNAGTVFTAKKADNRNTWMGVEVNGEVGYKLYDNMSALARAAYVYLGDYYNNRSTQNPNTDPANPYEIQLVLSYVF